MFENLLKGLSKMSNPYEGYLGELWNVWKNDAGRAVLMARRYWQRLPEELAQQAAMVQQQAQTAQASYEIDQQVNAQLGAMGIFPGAGGGASFGMDPDHAMFIMIMGLVRAYRGDPPTSQGWAQLAEPVLRGQMDPLDALVAATPPYNQQAIIAAIQMMAMVGMDQLMRLQAVIQVASALPRERIPVLIPELQNA